MRVVAFDVICTDSFCEDALMADPISIQCPHCKVKLKLKAAPPVGKKIGCPKCKKPFPVKAPPKKKESDDDFLDALDDLSEDDYEAPEDEDSQDEEEAAPAPSTMRSKGGASPKKGAKGKKGRAKKSSAGPILAIIGGSLAALALVGGVVYLLMNLPGGGGGIRSASGEFIAFAPSDADVYIAVRPADILASPVLTGLAQTPQVKQGFAEFENQFGFPPTEIDHAFVAVKTNAAGAGGGAPQGVPVGGNPMMGQPPGMMPGMAGPGANRFPVQDGVVLLRLKQPYGGKTLEQITQAAPTKSYKSVNYHVASGPNGGGFFFGDNRHVVMGEPSQIEKIIDRKDQAEDNTLLGYFAKDTHLTIVGSPKGAAAQSSLAPGFNPALLQNKELEKMVQDISTVRLDIHMPGSVDLKVVVTCKTDAAAQQIHAETTKQIGQLKQQAAFLNLMVPGIDSVVNTLQVNVSGPTMNVAASVPSALIDKLKLQAEQQSRGTPGLGSENPLPAGALPPGTFPPSIGQPTNGGTNAGDPVAAAQAAATRSRVTNNLKQVLLAFHNHHDTHNFFPSAFNVDGNGQPLLSWRVHVLPFLEQKALYDQFHLNEPWDSEHNKTLIAHMPNIYASEEQELVSQGRTRILVPTGPGMAFEGKDALKIPSFQDGTSNTLMAVEVTSSAAVIWTKPEDLVVDVAVPHRNLTGARGEGFMAAFADGVARPIKDSIAAETLKALFTRKGMEDIQPGSF